MISCLLSFIDCRSTVFWCKFLTCENFQVLVSEDYITERVWGNIQFDIVIYTHNKEKSNSSYDSVIK